ETTGWDSDLEKLSVGHAIGVAGKRSGESAQTLAARALFELRRTASGGGRGCSECSRGTERTRLVALERLQSRRDSASGVGQDSLLAALGWTGHAAPIGQRLHGEGGH